MLRCLFRAEVSREGHGMASTNIVLSKGWCGLLVFVWGLGVERGHQGNPGWGPGPSEDLPG